MAALPAVLLAVLLLLVLLLVRRESFLAKKPQVFVALQRCTEACGRTAARTAKSAAGVAPLFYACRARCQEAA
jgi:hypothetical protein